MCYKLQNTEISTMIIIYNLFVLFLFLQGQLKDLSHCQPRLASNTQDIGWIKGDLDIRSNGTVSIQNLFSHLMCENIFFEP